jgi:hypothetical protein
MCESSRVRAPDVGSGDATRCVPGEITVAASSGRGAVSVEDAGDAADDGADDGSEVGSEVGSDEIVDDARWGAAQPTAARITTDATTRARMPW